MIGGFIITGTVPKKVLIRGLGPSLNSAGIPDSVANPILRLFGSTGTQIAVNDNWQDTQRGEVEATGIPPTNTREAAMVATLNPGAYTATLAGADGGNGVGLVEVYDLDSGASTRLANISTRGSVQTLNNVMIGGFILAGQSPNPAKVVVRALGPSLQQFGIGNVLSNPSLEVVNSNGQSLIANDNWQDNAAQAAELQTLNIAPQDARESALVVTLPPGQYTAIVSGRNSSAGIGLIEVYTIR